MLGRSLPIWAAEGREPTHRLPAGEGKTGWPGARYAGVGLLTQKAQSQQALGQSLAPPRASGLSSFFLTDIMRHLLEEEGTDLPGMHAKMVCGCFWDWAGDRSCEIGSGMCARESECECSLCKCLCVPLYEETSICLSH